MCGRYLFDLGSDELKNYYDQLEPKAATNDINLASNEVFRSSHVVTLGLNQYSKVVPGIISWDFEEFKKAQLMINARAETVEEKKTFAKAFRNLRYLFPMSGFYEWDSNKQKFLFKVGEKQTLYIAEFYRIHKTDAGLKTESIIMTTKPNSSVSSVHDRMPLIVDRSHIEDWLNNLDFARTYLSADMPELKKMITEK